MTRETKAVLLKRIEGLEAAHAALNNTIRTERSTHYAEIKQKEEEHRKVIMELCKRHEQEVRELNRHRFPIPWGVLNFRPHLVTRMELHGHRKDERDTLTITLVGRVDRYFDEFGNDMNTSSCASLVEPIPF